MVTTDKRCIKCKITKPRTDFYTKLANNKNGTTRRCSSSNCKQCASDYTKTKRKLPSHIESYRRYSRNSARRRRFALLGADVAKLYDMQNNLCAICKSPEKHKRFALDHNHVTGKVRGLLCQQCNMAIGLLKDDPKIVRAAAEYIQKKEELHFSLWVERQLQTLVDRRFMAVN